MAVPKPRPSDQDRIRAATWFAGRGFGIFPVWSADEAGVCRCPLGPSCGGPGKHPMTREGFKEATTDPDMISLWLSGKGSPNYGMVPPEGVFVWDVDTDEERARLSELGSRLGVLPPTLRDATAHGEHVFWSWPASIPRPLKQMFGLVTRWGSGKSQGYVIGPRSVHASGVEYAPAEGTVWDIAELPDAWAHEAVSEEARGAHMGTDTTAGPDGSPRGSVVPPGSRHAYLRDKARSFRGQGLAGEALYAAIWDLNERYCDPPKTPDEVRRAIGEVERAFDPDPIELDADGRYAKMLPESVGILPRPESVDFPEAPSEIAFGGLIGECVRVLATGTDASLAGLLASMIAVCGVMVPAMTYSRGRQTSTPYIALVGESSIGRKGTAMDRIIDAARDVWPANHVNGVVLTGLNSGEALVKAMWDRAGPSSQRGIAVGLVQEGEYSTLLRSAARDGSTLDQKLRSAFDGTVLANLRSKESIQLDPPYWVAALTGITPAELRKLMRQDDALTGAANRWLYVPVVKRPGIFPEEQPKLPADLSTALSNARASQIGPREIAVDAAVSSALSQYAEWVLEVSTGVAQDMIRRYQTIAARIALVHAAVERSETVTMVHLDRAIALTEYARRGITWVFGQTVGARDSDLLLRVLQEQPDGRLAKNKITQHVFRDLARQTDAIDELQRLGLATVERRVLPRGGSITELVLCTRAHVQHLTPYNGEGISVTDVHELHEWSAPSVEETRPKRKSTRARRCTSAARVDARVHESPISESTDGSASIPPGREHAREHAREQARAARVPADLPGLSCEAPDEHRGEQIRITPDRWVCTACQPAPAAKGAMCPECRQGPWPSEALYERHWYAEHDIGGVA